MEYQKGHYGMTHTPQTPIAVEHLLAEIEARFDPRVDTGHWPERRIRIDDAAAAVRRAQGADEYASWQTAPRQLSPREMMSHLGNFV